MQILKCLENQIKAKLNLKYLWNNYSKSDEEIKLHEFLIPHWKNM